MSALSNADETASLIGGWTCRAGADGRGYSASPARTVDDARGLGLGGSKLL